MRRREYESFLERDHEMMLEKTTGELRSSALRIFKFIEDLGGVISAKDTQYMAALPEHGSICIQLIQQGRKKPDNSIYVHCRWREELAGDGVQKGNDWFGSSPSAGVIATANHPLEMNRAETFILRAWAANQDDPQSDRSSPIANPPPAVDLDEPPSRIESVVSRILRDTQLANWVKRQHDYCCQICGHRISLPDGSGYAEGHHIRPLGGSHAGPDSPGNILCLCPNHHALCDLGAIPLELNVLRKVDGHVIGDEFVEYHNETICKTRWPQDSHAAS